MPTSARDSAKLWREKLQEMLRERASYTDVGRLINALMADAIHHDDASICNAARALILPYLLGGRPRAPFEIEGSVSLNLIDWTKPWSPPQTSSTTLPTPSPVPALPPQVIDAVSLELISDSLDDDDYLASRSPTPDLTRWDRDP